MLDELPLERQMLPRTPQPQRNLPSAGQRVFFGLLYASGLQVLTVAGVFLFTMNDPQTDARNLVIGQAFAVGMIFGLLALLARRFPLFAALTAVSVFFAANIVLALLIPGTLMNGFLLKLLILIILMRSLLSALEERART